MSSSVGLHARLTASTEKFESGMKDVSTRLEKVEKASKDTAKGMSLLAKIEIGKLLFSGLSRLGGMFKSLASGAKQFFDNTRDMIDQLGKLSAQTGMAVEPLQVLQQLAEYAGLELGSFTSAAQKMSRSLGDAQRGGGAAGKALKEMGLELDTILRMSPSQQFMTIGNAIASVEDPTLKSAYAASVFGRNGMLMIPMFKDIKKNAMEVGKEMGLLGQILTKNQVTAVETMNDAFVKVGATIAKIGGQVIGNLAPMITQITNDLLDFVKLFEFGGSTGGNAIADALTRAFFKGAEVLAAVFDALRDAFDGFMAGLVKFNKGLYDIARIFGYESSSSEMGKVWEANIAEIDSQLASLHRGIKNNNSNIENGLDAFGLNAAGLADKTKKVAELTTQRKHALDMMNEAEGKHLEEKRKATGQMGSLTNMVKAYADEHAAATKNGGLTRFMKSIDGMSVDMFDFSDAIGNTGVKAIELLTNPSKMFSSALGKAERGFYDLLKPLGVTPQSLQAWAEKLTATMTPAEMLGKAATSMVDGITYMSGAFGTDLVNGVNGAAQGFLDIMAPLGYTTEKILEMGKAAEMEANFKEGLIGGSMSAWDQVAKQMADQYINQGANPFEVYRKMMEERNKKLSEVTAHFDSLQKAADKTSSSMETLHPSLATIAEGMPKALETAVGKFNTATESIADFFGMGEDSPPMEPEKDYTTTLTNSETLLGTIASGISGLSFPVASIF
jgi:hypothetical protein